MATGKSLTLRKIQPRLRPSAWEPNEHRREAKRLAKVEGVSVRRVKRRLRREAIAAKLAEHES